MERKKEGRRKEKEATHYLAGSLSLANLCLFLYASFSILSQHTEITEKKIFVIYHVGHKANWQIMYSLMQLKWITWPYSICILLLIDNQKYSLSFSELYVSCRATEKPQYLFHTISGSLQITLWKGKMKVVFIWRILNQNLHAFNICSALIIKNAN